MQAFLGVLILIVVTIGSAVGGYNLASKEPSGIKRIWMAIGCFALMVVCCYLAFAVVGGVFWVIAEIGIWLRNILQWLIGAVLYPFNWLF